MTTLEAAGKTLELNEEGFLLDAREWTPELAEALAESAGLGPLSDKHWRVITVCREDAARRGQAPGLRRISELSGVGMKELYRLFPSVPDKQAARIAGLPKPRAGA